MDEGRERLDNLPLFQFVPPDARRLVIESFVAMEVLEQHHDLEEVRALLGHARIDTTQVYASIGPPDSG